MSPDEILAVLDEDQRRVATHVEGPLCVAAGAGSGKSRSLVHRVAYLQAAHGVDPRRVLAVTFSKRAAAELDARLVALGIRTARVGTFHSLCRELLRRELPDFESWRPDGVDDADGWYENLARQAVGRRDANVMFGDEHLDWKDGDLTAVRAYVELCKARAAAPDSEVARDLALRCGKGLRDGAENLLAAYDLIERKRLAARFMTFSDWLVETERLLRDPACRARWASRWDFTMQDECQDQNEVQVHIVEWLSERHRNYAMVGDRQQEIFSFRGADSSLFATFPERWGAPVVRLRNNYRSGDAIVAAGNRIAAQMPSAIGVEMVPRRGVRGRVRVAPFMGTSEADFVADAVARNVEAGMRPSDHAVLYRTRATSRAFEEAFTRREIPFRVAGGSPFYERPDARNLLAYARVLGGGATVDDVVTTLRAPFRFLSKAFLDRARREGENAAGRSWSEILTQLVEQMPRGFARESAGRTCAEYSDLMRWLREWSKSDERPTPHQILEAVVARTRYTAWVTRDEGRGTVDRDRVADVAELLAAARLFDTLPALVAHARDAVEVAREAQKAGEVGNRSDRVTLMTIHSSKGLEFPVVFLVDCREGQLPHARATDKTEERRLFYVGVTRARDELVVTYSGAPSPFLREAKLDADEAEPSPVTSAAPLLGPGTSSFDPGTLEDVPF